MTTDFRALCAELVNELHGYKALHPEHGTDLIDLACQGLATPPPEPPSEEDLLRLWQFNFGKTPKDRFMDIAHFVLALATPPPEASGSPTDEEIRELSGQTWGDKELVRAALERWGK